ncbi:Vegetative incompatibility protein HET-E-1 [Ceratocystis platani]|uniref:Vegetative incompatibility protein HET-E-1 n=1 Tax=Ceratocystis fimbriata f. sp. platani TaxID=88771 RepID=A0A0F8BKD6_CERFI|nr:Vegetative incompatibility protein HET-E-1 [Ceratocystis platani]
MNQDSVSQAVKHYIQSKVDEIERKKGFGQEAKKAISEHLKKNSGGTFLWKFPAGLSPLYRRMLEDINQSEDKELYNDILAKALVVYRPITLKELRVLIVDLEALEDEEIKEVINSCGSLLATHNDVVSFVHQSAKDYLLSEALGSDDKTVKIRDATSGACLQTLEGHDHYVTSVAFSTDGQRLASGSYDKTVKIWDATSGACLQTLEGHDDGVMSVIFSTDGQRLASGSRDETVKIWDATSGACLQTLEDYGSKVTPAVFANNGQQIQSGPSSSQASLLHSRSCIYSLSDDEVWIMENGQRVLWLPPSYRPWDFAIADSRLALGTSSGRVAIMVFRSGD